MTAVRIVGGLLLAWNLVGALAFAAQASMDVEALAATDPASAAAFAAMPGWVWAAYAAAVATGTAGSVALLLARRAAVPLFGISLAALVVQFGWSFGVYGVLGKIGASAAVLPAFIVGSAVVAVGVAARWAAEGRLR